MPKEFHQCVVRIFSFFLALYIFNFSVDVPSHLSNPQFSKHNSIGSPEVENLLEIILNIQLSISMESINPGDCESDIEKDATDILDLFHSESRNLTIQNHPSFFKKSGKENNFFLNGRIMEVICPPPQS